MKLNKLRVQRFRNIADTTLDATGAKFVVLRGANRNGKTSIAEALSLALTSTTFGLSAKGDGYARKIKRGETKAVLEAELQGTNRVIKRTVTLNVNSTGRTQVSEDVADPAWNSVKFDKLLTDKKAALEIAINTRAFQSMIYSGDEKGQKNLLAQLVLPARYDFPKETIADVDSILGEGTIGFLEEPFSVIEQAYKKLFAERQEVNRKLKDFILPSALPRPQGVDSESLNAQLATLRDERKKQEDERKVASSAATEAALKAQRVNSRIETLGAMLKASKESLRTLEANILPDPVAVQAIAENKSKYDALIKELASLGILSMRAKDEKDAIQAKSAMGSTCPTCGQDMDEAKQVQLMTEVIAKRTDLAMKECDAGEALKLLGDVDGAIAKLEKHKLALANKAELMAKIEIDSKTLQMAEMEASQSVGGLFESSVLDNAIAETERSIETILQQMQPVIAAEEREKDIATKKEQLLRLERKASKLDSLVKFFDKDGIKAKLISDHIGGFEKKVNEVLSAWKYFCTLSIEPFKFEVTDYRGVATPVIDLSGAEELMFYAAFQCAVSRTAGIGFVVIDRVDTLLADLRPSLFKNLYQMVTEGLLDQVILLIADTSEQIPKLAESRFFVIEEGNIRRLG
jgi:DNA repair exonuclease SbcCD ATPase subunit